MADVVSRRSNPADALPDARPAPRIAALTTFRRAALRAALRLDHLGAPAKTAHVAAVILDSADAQRGADAVRSAGGALLGTEKRLVERSGRVRFCVQYLTNRTHEVVGVHRMREPRVASHLDAVLGGHLRDFR